MQRIDRKVVRKTVSLAWGPRKRCSHLTDCRSFDDKDEVVSLITRQSIDTLSGSLDRHSVSMYGS